MHKIHNRNPITFGNFKLIVKSLLMNNSFITRIAFGRLLRASDLQMMTRFKKSKVSCSTDCQPDPREPQDIGISNLILGTSGTVPSQAVLQPALSLGDHRAFATEETLKLACQQLSQLDPLLAPLIELHGLPTGLLAKSDDSHFATLSKSIIFQQLATGAAAAINAR